MNPMLSLPEQTASSPNAAQRRIFAAFGALVVVSILLAVSMEQIAFLLLPFGTLVIFQALVDYEKLFLLLWACVPISTEVDLPGGFGTDLPVEPLIVGLALLYLIRVLSRPETIDGNFLRHPITVLLILHLIWTTFTAIVSDNFAVSLKFLLAKSWYVLTFYFLSNYMLRSEASFRRLFWWFMLPMSLATLKVVLHHAALDFGFREINQACVPFFRNHVSYAALLALALPIAWFARHLYARWSLQWWLIWAATGLWFFALLFAYTRAAYVALVLAIGAYWVVRFRLMRPALLLGAVMAVFAVVYLAQNNKYIDFAPSERTIAHEDFQNILAATYKLEDVSTMERYYRWIAGVRMSQEDLAAGWGPGNFYNFYKAYTLNRFETYVSDNPEKSGVHNYFLMLLAEQGILGVLIFVALIFVVLLQSEQLYYRLSCPRRRTILLAALLSTVVIYAFLLMNDMVETDKVGSFFFMLMSLIVAIDRWERVTNYELRVTNDGA